MFIKETIDYIDSVLKAGLTDVRLQRAKYFGLCRFATVEDSQGKTTITTTITDDGNGEAVTIDDSESITIWHTTSNIQFGQPWIKGGGFGDDTQNHNPSLVTRCRMIVTGRTEQIKISSERLGSIVMMKIPGLVPTDRYGGIIIGLHGISIGIIDIITDQAQCALIAGHNNTPGITTAVINYQITENISKNCIATCEQYSFTGC